MARYDSKYSFELWNAQGQLLLDLGGYANNREFSITRNDADDISFEMNLDEFEAYCTANKVVSSSVLIVNSTEVKVKRLGTYVAGGQINYIHPSVSATSQSIEIRATGFLNLFSDRYTDDARIFTATQATTIAWTAISESQALTNGDYGVTQGTLATIGVHDRTYNRACVKDVIKNLSESTLLPFDFEFTPSKVFNTYTRIGADRPEIQFEYPGNVLSVGVPIDGTGTANQIIGLGAGYGSEQAVYTANDSVSQLNYKLRQKIVTVNDADGTDNTLSDATNAQKDTYANPLKLPNIVLDGNQPPYLTDYKIGDRVQVKVSGYNYLKYINGMYRIEKISVQVDDDDNEQITLEVDL